MDRAHELGFEDEHVSPDALGVLDDAGAGLVAIFKIADVFADLDAVDGNRKPRLEDKALDQTGAGQNLEFRVAARLLGARKLDPVHLGRAVPVF